MKKNQEFILKILLPIIAFVLLLYASVIYPKTINKYDVNRDGKVNSKDLLDLRVYLINKGE
jgi:hypothetical protein